MKKLILGEQDSMAILVDIDNLDFKQYPSSYDRIDYIYVANEDMLVSLGDKELEAKSGDIIIKFYSIGNGPREFTVISDDYYRDYINRYSEYCKSRDNGCVSEASCDCGSLVKNG